MKGPKEAEKRRIRGRKKEIKKEKESRRRRRSPFTCGRQIS